MFKMLRTLIYAVITYYGGLLLAQSLFGPITGPDEVVTGCCIFVGTAIWAIRRMISFYIAESSAVRVAAYEARRDARFREIERRYE